ncbi:hypothetical protein M413DRAFT_8500 [Hebeloma cylindrosporum]|uniref:NADP-dependent oxidoreductase domain-containing protein n=1 Tax=Hebeloma cylindrosporum TaxID=76867 RepID=A0A0C3CM76_HEBCY|nr:hypothetical protein M413DRAFT_8500 [Hebeloma cylindrosporum h7]
MALTIDSTVTLSSGHKMSRLGFGAFENSDVRPMLEAFKVGYRHVDSAQWYGNEAQVADAVRESGLDRGDVFVPTKCISETHGYESTKKGIDDFLAKMKFDYVDLFLIHDPLSGMERRLARHFRSPKLLERLDLSVASILSKKKIVEYCKDEYCKDNDIVVEANCPIISGKMDHPVIQEVAAKYNATLLRSGAVGHSEKASFVRKQH